MRFMEAVSERNGQLTTMLSKPNVLKSVEDAVDMNDK
jgi:hypothetical protein